MPCVGDVVASVAPQRPQYRCPDRTWGVKQCGHTVDMATVLTIYTGARKLLLKELETFCALSFRLGLATLRTYDNFAVIDNACSTPLVIHK